MDDNRFATVLQTARDFATAINHPDNEGDLGELLNEVKFTPEVLAQILMEHLPVPDINKRLTPEIKMFWMRVATHMGPDWIEEFKNVGAFMSAVDEF